MIAEPRRGLDQLASMSRSGELAVLCEQQGIALLVVFGSVLAEVDHPSDLDLAVRFHTKSPDTLGFLDSLSRGMPGDYVDLMVLNDAGPVARERALVGGRPLYEAHPGEFANAQIAAIMERLDTDWLRKLDLELMS